MNLEEFDPTKFDLGEFMADVGRAGVRMMLKIDHERLAEGGQGWTVLLSGPLVGGSGTVRWDLRRLEQCIDVVVDRLKTMPGDWEWLELYE
ncbi:hypothetical protein E1263_02830 [Kribbella antibiotica]|uniref:Uncharacterized protein n=1 Tax=Kribbella antibiotica TaxID=190195 RepID=A0A4R4ZX05_9ACTN|nr:hypothetical protein [Kribbella antibiotica]TDD62669.1 hypothetical protein E1263_02830 [Kribbella antibiotica]